MQRSRFPQHPPDTPFTRRDGYSRSREDNKTVDLFYNFRQFRPYLKKRLKKIHDEKRERELRDEVEDIKYFLSVMSDMLADENHGAEGLQTFIDRIHEMVRKNPLHDNAHQESGDSSGAEDERRPPSTAPRSPSPVEVMVDSFSDGPVARTIPLEREPPREFSYFGSLEESIEKQVYEKKKKPTGPGNPWDSQTEHFTFRGPTNQDIDMRDLRSEPIYKPTMNSPMGQGAARSHQWQESNGNYRSGYGRGASRDENYYDWDERLGRNYSGQQYGTEGNFADKSVDDPWMEARGNNYNRFVGRGRGAIENDYSRPSGRGETRDFNSHQQNDREDYTRNYNRRDGQSFERMERPSSYTRESSYDRTRDTMRNQEQSLFDRRPQFERRKHPSSSNSFETERPRHIDYNHGGSEEQTWDNGSVGSGSDRDMRFQQSVPAPNIFSPSHFDQQQQQPIYQPNLNFGMNQFMHNSSMLPGVRTVNPIIPAGLGMQTLPVPNVGLPPIVHVQSQNPQSVGQVSFGQTNIQPGLLPNPVAQSFSFEQSPPPQPPRAPPAPTQSESYASHLNRNKNNPESLSSMIEIHKQKAQQCFSRNSIPRKDNQNVPPISTGPQHNPPPSKPANESMLASNQLLSDRDPRLNRLNKKNSHPQVNSNDFHSSQNSRTHKPQETPVVSDHRRADNDRRLSHKPREDHRGRRTSEDTRTSYKHREESRGDHSRNMRTDSVEDNRDRGGRSNLSPNSRRVGIDENRHRNKNSTPSSAEIPDRVARVNLEPNIRSGRLDEVRNRVRSSIPSTTQPKTSKLQEIRKQVEKEGFHALGRSINKKNYCSFDEAIVVPVEPPSRPPLKDSSKGSQPRDSSKEKTVDDNTAHKKLQKDKSKIRKRNAKIDKSDNTKKSKKKEKRGSKSKDSPSVPDNSLSQNSVGSPKKAVFRIPKIKRPEPIAPTREPSPPVPTSVDREESDPGSHDEHNTSGTSSSEPSDRLQFLTDDLIKQFIRAGLEHSEAEAMIANPDSLASLRERLQSQLKLLGHDSSASQSADTGHDAGALEGRTSAEPEIEIPESPTVEHVDSIEPGGHRSRSSTKKRCTKRRSSLEKLHDALKEMRFDTMLPLGPRRCTIQPEDPHDSASSQASADTNEMGQKSKEPKIVFDQLQKLLVASTKKTKKNQSNAAQITESSPEKGITSDVSTTEDLEKVEQPSTSTTGAKRGRKRKRKGSALKPNKKKKGPVTRAQAAVKSALKIQHKDKAKPTGDLSVSEKKKANSQTVSPNSEARVTRSMLGRNSLVTNLGLEKIKIESDYIPPKEEPEDHNDTNDGEYITEEAELEHLETNITEPESDTLMPTDESVNDVYLSPTIGLDLNIDEIDIDEEMSLDIKNEPETDTADDFINGGVGSYEEDTNEVTVKVEIETDTNYSTDLSFLPDLPVIDSVFTVEPEGEDSAIQSLFSKIVREDSVSPDIPDIDMEDYSVSSEGRTLSPTSSILSVMDDTLDKCEELSKGSDLLPPQPVPKTWIGPPPRNRKGFVPSSIRLIEKDLEEPNDFYISDSGDEDSSGTDIEMDDDDSESEDDDPESLFSKADHEALERRKILRKRAEEERASTTIPDNVKNLWEKLLAEAKSTADIPEAELRRSHKQCKAALMEKMRKRYKVGLHGDVVANWSIGHTEAQSSAEKRNAELNAIELAFRTNRNEAPDGKLDLDNLKANSEGLSSNNEESQSGEGEVTSSHQESQGGKLDADHPEVKIELDQQEAEEGELESEGSQQEAQDEKLDSDNLEAPAGRVTHLKGRSLYVCANQPCDFTAVNATLFKDHVTICPFTSDSKQVGCAHCDKRVKAIPHLLEHLKIHGRQKQLCAICPFKAWVNSELTRHMKTFHKVYTYKVEKVEMEAKDEDPAFVMYPKDVASRVHNLKELKESYARYADRLTFKPEDVEKVPARQIFHTLAYCSVCDYSSKVRINFIRHLQAHASATENPEMVIPKSDPVNPVPCLERKELMFDKMTNWAGSTHDHKQESNIANDNAALPQFVSEQFRYVCNVAGCEQITVDEFMLRTHVRTLHSEVDFYQCPHCDKNEATRNDKRNTVPVDKLGAHLKLHGPKLYRCAYCDVIHTQVLLMEKHLPEKHPEKKPIHYLIRNLDPDGNAANRRSSSDDTTVADKWRCGLCSSKTLFATYEEVKSHCQSTHRVDGQFGCGYCKRCVDTEAAMKVHFIVDHKKDRKTETHEEWPIMVMWYRNEFDMKPDDIVHGPLWKRSSQHIKHIRGIFLEDSKERVPKSDSTSVSKPSGSNSTTETAPKNSIASGNGPKKSKANLSDSSAQKAAKVCGDNSVVQPVLPMMICPKCNLYKTKNPKDMTVHLHNELRYQRYCCTACQLKFVTESSLKGHYTGDHGLQYGLKACHLLDADPEIEAYVEKFLLSQTPKPPAETVTFPCKHCRQECQSAHNLKTHVLAKHLAADRFKCNHCPMTFWSEPLVRSHHSRIHKDLPVSIVEDLELISKLTPKFWLEEYGIVVKKPAVRKDPVFNITKPKVDLLPKVPNVIMYPCPHCRFETDSVEVLESHIDEFHPEEDDNNLLFDVDNDDAPLHEDISTPMDPDMHFLGDILGMESAELDLATPSIIGHRSDLTHAYKCFHCGDNFFTIRGARSHWLRSHSKRPEERCNYYEYKSVNANKEMPAFIQICCTFCDYIVSSIDLIYDHHHECHRNQTFRLKRKVRSGTTIIACAHCWHESSNISELRNHNQSSHPDFEVEYTRQDSREKARLIGGDFIGKLIEDSVRYGCRFPNCKLQFESRLNHRSHVLSDHDTTDLEPQARYTRHVINPRVKVPVDDEATEDIQVFQCPVCEYQSEDRQKLVTDHLGEHIFSYICPTCDNSFKSYMDTKFHIRHSHADPHGTPSINRDMYRDRELLENAISQVPAVGRK